jgi:lipopolysaccharide export system permease protein
MYHVLAHRPGGQPIGALERFFALIAKRVKGLVSKARSPAPAA